MQVAADVGELDEQRRRAQERRLAELGRAPRQTEQRVHAFLVRRVRQRAERRDVLGRAGGAEQLRAEALGWRDDELDGDPLDGDADRAARLPLDDADDRRRGLEPLERVGRARDERELVDGLAPAADLARDLGVELVREPLRECARPVEQ